MFTEINGCALSFRNLSLYLAKLTIGPAMVPVEPAMPTIEARRTHWPAAQIDEIAAKLNLSLNAGATALTGR